MPRRFFLPRRPRPDKIPHHPMTLHLGIPPRWMLVVMGTMVVVAGTAWLISVSDFPGKEPATTIQAEHGMDAAIGHLGGQLPGATRDSVVDEAVSDLQVAGNAALDGSATEIKAPAHVIRLQLLNGCGEKGIAKRIAPVLRAKGFDVRETSNAGSFGYDHSQIWDRAGDLADALIVADSLGIDHSRVYAKEARNLPDIDVTIVVGLDYASLNFSLPMKVQE